jgi:hypothetical protein
MNVQLKQVFDAPVDIVLRARDERFAHIEKIPGLKPRDILERKETATGWQTRRAFEAGENAVPGAVKRMLSPDMFKFVEHLTFDAAAKTMTWHMEPAAQKDNLTWKGVSRFVDRADGKSERIIDCTVRVKAPIIGGQLEKAIASGFKKSMEKDHATIQAMIALINKGEV